MDKVAEQELRADVRRVFSSLAIVAPFAYPLLMMPIVIREDISGWAGTNGVTFFVNPREWLPLSFREKLFVAMHEWVHVVMMHVKRVQGRRRRAFNYACFPEDTVVSGANKDISKLNVNDKVFQQNSLGVSQKIMVRKYSGKFITIKPWGSCEIKVTPEHPFLVAIRQGTYTPVAFKEGLHWVTAKDLRPKKHYLVFPNVTDLQNVNEINVLKYINSYTDTLGREYIGKTGRAKLDKLNINNDTAWLMGLYLADGSKDSGSIKFHLGSHEVKIIDRVETVAEKIGYSHSRSLSHNGKMTTVIVGSTILSRLFADIIGKKFDTKIVPDQIFYHNDKEIVKSFVDGVHAGDGFNSRNSKGITLSNKPAILQLQLMLLRCGIFSCVSKRLQRDRKINGRFVKGGKEIYYLRWSENNKTSFRQLNGNTIRTSNARNKFHQDHMVTPIVNIKEEDFDGSVYNLECDKDHTYSVNNFVVHNCDFAANDMIINDMSDHFDAPPGVLFDSNFLYDKTAEENYNILLEAIDEQRRQNVTPFCNYCSKVFTKDDVQAAPGETRCDACGRASPVTIPAPDYLELEDAVYQLMVADFGTPWGNDLSQMPSTADDQQMIDAIIKSAARARGMKRGFMPGKYQEYVDKLKKSNIPWERVLFRFAREALKGTTDRNPFKPDPKYLPFDIFIPTEKGRNIGKLVFIVDTSASMDKIEFEVACGHLQRLGSICDKCTVITADTKVQEVIKVKKIKHELSKNKIKFKGRGGTSMKEAFEVAEKLEPDLIILFSDMVIGEFPPKPKRAQTIFLATPGSDMEESPYGVFIKMEKR